MILGRYFIELHLAYDFQSAPRKCFLQRDFFVKKKLSGYLFWIPLVSFHHQQFLGFRVDVGTLKKWVRLVSPLQRRLLRTKFIEKHSVFFSCFTVKNKRRSVYLTTYRSLTLRDVAVATSRDADAWRLDLRLHCEKADAGGAPPTGVWSVRLTDADGRSLLEARRRSKIHRFFIDGRCLEYKTVMEFF